MSSCGVECILDFFSGFVDFDDYEAVDLVSSQREHFIEGHRMRVELALPMVNDSLYEKDVLVPGKLSI